MVSIIIPVYNGEKFLQRSVDSALSQIFNDDIILIDDCSTDSSLELMKNLYGRNKNIVILELKSNYGAPYCRNLGMKFSKYNWIQFLDVDDVIDSKKISNQINLIGEDVSVIFGNYYSILENGKTIRKESNKDLWVGLIKGELGITSSNLWNRYYLHKVNGWNQNLTSSQEYDLIFRIIQINQNVKYSNEFDTTVYWNTNSISRKLGNRKNIVLNWWELRVEIKDYLKSINKFTIKQNYFFTGKIGYLKKRYPHWVKEKINPILFFMYQISFNVKKILNISI